jgi:hypothetical protein|tara:strand:- start:2025 stop:2474 length:450 start_codon:yes stop_codon:yes gene_type:complete
MAIISSYPTITPTSSDLVLIVDTSTDGNPTKTATINGIGSLINAGFTGGYTVYTALITQAGTAAPVATILQNTTGGTFTYARTSGGDYTVTVSGNLFTVNKTLVFLNGGSSENNHDIAWERASDTVINLSTHNSDGKFTAGSIEIRIYS